MNKTATVFNAFYTLLLILGLSGCALLAPDQETQMAEEEQAAQQATPLMTVVSQPSVEIESTPYEESLGAELTALEAYDALLPVVASDVEDLPWLSLSGSSDQGWLFEFYRAEDDQKLLFQVLPDGSLNRLPDEPLERLTEDAPVFLQRDQIQIDSDQAEQLAIQHDVIPEDADQRPLLFLRSVEEGQPEWLVQSRLATGYLRIDARTGEVSG